jgi:hypothetical protein
MKNSDTITLRPGGFYVEKGSDPFVRVPDAVFKGVAYIGEVAGHDELGNAYGDFQGTGFFVQVPSENLPGTSFVYIVTAKHVLTDIKKDVYILLNGKDGGVKQLKSIGPEWWSHPNDKSADVAVRQVGFQDDVDLLAIQIKDFIRPEDIKTSQVVPGDEVFLAGLFSPAPGIKRNLPITRHGNIAMLPDEQVETEFGYADVYLVEARSIGGLSGSPVFVRPPLRYGIEMPKGTTAYFDAIGKFRLLGLMHGHWDIRETEINNSKIEHDRKKGVNLGIGIVVPAIKILETINHPELIERRRLSEEDMAKRRKSIPGMDSAKSHEKESEQPLTRADFEAALRKASRKKTDET